MLSVSLMEPILHPAPKNITAKIHYGEKEWDIATWPCNVSFPLPPEHDLTLDFGKTWQESLGVLNLPLPELHKDGRLPLQMWVSLEKERDSPSSGMEHLSAVMKRAELIKSPKMHLLLTISNIDAMMMQQASHSALMERKDLESAWMCEMQELQRGLEDANRKLEASIEITKSEEALFDDQLSQLCAQTERHKQDFQVIEKERDAFELRAATLQQALLDAQTELPTCNALGTVSRHEECEDVACTGENLRLQSDVEELTSELLAEKEAIKEWERNHEAALLQVRVELAETNEELTHYVGIAESLEDENKKLADMLERRNGEWKSEIQSLERRLKADRKPEPRRAGLTANGGISEDITKVRALRKEVEKLKKEKDESEKAHASVRSELQSTRARLASVEKEKDEAIREREHWQRDAENLEGEIAHLERTLARQLASLESQPTIESQLYVSQDQPPWSAPGSPKDTVLQPAHSFETKRARWPKQSELIREGAH